MKWMKLGCCVLAMAGLTAPSAQAAPSAPRPAVAEAATANILFDPPLDAPVRYRIEKVIADAKRTRSNWDVSSYAFTKTEGGYRMTVTPESSGSNETDPLLLRVEQELAELTRLPYTVTLDEDGAITGIEDIDRYWAAIFDAFDKAIKADERNSLSPEMRASLAAVVNSFRSIPPAGRVTLMTEQLGPIVEWANTQTTVGEPIHATLEGESPYGGKIIRDIYVNLDRIEDDEAVIRTNITMAPDQMKALTLAYIERVMAAVKPGTAIPKDVADKLTIVYETQAEYHVSLIDGLLGRFASTETIKAEGAGQDVPDQTRVTSRKVARLD